MGKSIIFFIQNFSLPAGSERVTSIIANQLLKQGHSITVLSICGDNTCFYDLDPNIRLHTLIPMKNVDNRKYFLKVLLSLNKFYKKYRPDICIDVFAALSIYTLILKPKYHYKNISWEHFNYKVNTGMNRLGRKLACKFSDQIVTLTDTDKEYYLKDNHVRGHIDWILNPSPYQNAKRSMEKEKIILSVGRLTEQKGIDRLIKVWKKVEPYTDYWLLILGEGELRKKIQNLIDEYSLKQIKLVGAVKNVAEYYSKSMFYVSTARFEGLPMTMIEAQSFGLPVVSFDYDTGPRDIICDGCDGFLIRGADEEDNINLMANKILELINNPQKLLAMGDAAQTASKRFFNDRIGEKWNKVIDRL